MGSFPATKNRSLLLWHTLIINLRRSLILMYQFNRTIKMLSYPWRHHHRLLFAGVKLGVFHHMLRWKGVRKIAIIWVIDVVTTCDWKDIIGFIISFSNSDVFKVPLCWWSLNWKLISGNHFLNLILHPTRAINILLQVLKCSTDCYKTILSLPILHFQLMIFNIWILLGKFYHLQTRSRHLQYLDNDKLRLFHFVEFLNYIGKHINMRL